MQCAVEAKGLCNDDLTFGSRICTTMNYTRKTFMAAFFYFSFSSRQNAGWARSKVNGLSRYCIYRFRYVSLNLMNTDTDADDN